MTRDTQSRAAFSIEEFCSRNAICRASLYNLWRAGIGPRFMTIAKHRRITAEAETDWHRDREEAAANTTLVAGREGRAAHAEAYRRPPAAEAAAPEAKKRAMLDE